MSKVVSSNVVDMWVLPKSTHLPQPEHSPLSYLDAFVHP